MDPSRLSSVPLFQSLSRHEREQVARWADEIDVPAGITSWTRAGSPTSFFVVLEGTVEVTQDGRHLTDLGPGDFFGGIALLEAARRTATVVATTPARAVVMHGAATSWR